MTFRHNVGVAFSQDNKSMQDGSWKYDSRKPKLTVDIDIEPPHLKLFEMNGGTKFVLNAAASQFSEEILYQVEHKMPFPPAFLCFFYTIDTPLGGSSAIGRYSQNRTFMLTNAIALGEEGLYAKVDDKYFYIFHFAETFSFGAGNTTFYGSDYRFRVRYEILNQRALYLGDKGY